MKKVSQSLLKDLMEYESGELCGNVLQAKLDGVYPDDTGSKPGKPSAAKLGQYFEYITFGNLPAHGDGSIPRAEYTGDGMKKCKLPEHIREPWTLLTVDDMYADYKHCHRKSDKVKRYMKAMKMEVVYKGKAFENEWGKGQTDIIVKCKMLGKGEIVIDMKYTGLMDATWSKSKFAWNLDNPALNELQGVQPKQYKWLTTLEFYYWLVSSSATNDDMRLIKANVSDDAMLKFREEAMIIKNEKLPLYEATGFEPRPSLLKCDFCPLNQGCKDRAQFPAIVEVDFN